ncbi:hypothetical protein TIFTF001_000526 [Ficus carica]|uniref:Pentatricopeptide repeat-containing protein n=1 Tax=Ficus carica TaxID=3494 RepID=A0AA88CN94_FICCA|nr:hypothetical protein TIFTF001_000526 [Ficus carica]
MMLRQTEFKQSHPTNTSSSCCDMIHSGRKAIQQTQANLVPCLINVVRCSPQYHTDPSHGRPHRAPPKLRMPTPFVSAVKEAQDPDEALSLFHEYQQTMGFKHDYTSYSALIYKLARFRDFEAVETVLDHVHDRNVRCGEKLFIVLIQHYGKADLVEKAIELFHRIPTFNCVRTLQSLNALLNVLVDGLLFSEANDLFYRSFKMCFRPNSISFNIIIKGWLRKGDWEEASKVFDEMLERNVQPSVVTYNSLIGYLCKKGELDKSKDLIEDMIEKGKPPNAVTYALMMEGLCSIGKYKEAKKMMFDMEYRGCKPKLVNFGILMTDLGRRGKIEEAKLLLSEMKKRRFKPDVVTYNILINYLCKEGKAVDAYKILTEMQIEGCEPNAATYRIMVDGLCRVGDFKRGLKILNAMLTSQHCPRFESFHCLIMGLVKCGNLEGACFVLEEMEKRKMHFGLEGWEALVVEACDRNSGVGGLVTELISTV